METRRPLKLPDKMAQSDNRMDVRKEGDSNVSFTTSTGVPIAIVEGPVAKIQSTRELPPSENNQPKSSGLESGLTVIGPSSHKASHKADEAFSSLLNEITLPLLKAEDETKPDGKWEPKELRPRHREMMRRILEGATYVEIAEEMGLSTQSVMLVCSSAMFKEELRLLDAELNLNVIRRAEELSNEALDKLKVLMRRAKSEALQASCAERVLGIAGYSKIEKKQVQVISGEDVIRELNRRRRELTEQRQSEQSRAAIENARTVSIEPQTSAEAI